jgi:hypothetical protein
VLGSVAVEASDRASQWSGTQTGPAGLGRRPGRRKLAVKLATTAAIAGVLFGYVLQRSDLCFHSAWRGVFERRYHLTKIWLLGVAVATVGLSLVYASDRWRLNEAWLSGRRATSGAGWFSASAWSWPRRARRACSTSSARGCLARLWASEVGSRATSQAANC